MRYIYLVLCYIYITYKEFLGPSFVMKTLLPKSEMRRKACYNSLFFFFSLFSLPLVMKTLLLTSKVRHGA